MGVKLSELEVDGTAYRAGIHKFASLLLFRHVRPWLYLDIYCKLLGYSRKVDEALKPVQEFTKAIIKQRRKHLATNMKAESFDVDSGRETKPKQRLVMLDTLLQAQQLGQIDEEGINEEVTTVTYGGHDSSASALTFTLLLLAHNAEAQERIFDEFQDLTSRTKEADLAMDDFNKLEYLDRAMKESMRIYPSIPTIGRDMSDGLIQAVCNIHIFDLHRDPEVFPDPEKFDPDRFLSENCANRNKFAYIPFSTGLRNCVGQRYALLLLKVVLTKIIKNFIIHPVTEREEVFFIPDIVLRSVDPVKIRFELRSK